MSYKAKSVVHILLFLTVALQYFAFFVVCVFFIVAVVDVVAVVVFAVVIVAGSFYLFLRPPPRI